MYLAISDWNPGIESLNRRHPRDKPACRLLEFGQSLIRSLHKKYHFQQCRKNIFLSLISIN